MTSRASSRQLRCRGIIATARSIPPQAADCQFSAGAKPRRVSPKQHLAERTGFEPAVGLPTHAFQACPLSRSGTSPQFARSSATHQHEHVAEPNARNSRALIAHAVSRQRSNRQHRNSETSGTKQLPSTTQCRECTNKRAEAYGGEGGIRTRDPGYPRYRFSRPALSTTQPPLHALSHQQQRCAHLTDSISRALAADEPEGETKGPMRWNRLE